MEGKYIFALIVLGAFFLLIFISFAFLERGRIKDEKLQDWIKERYNDKNINKYNYDSEGEEEIPLQNAETTESEDEIEEESVAEVHIEDPYGKIDIEGIEEITGNYNGDK